jgi:hypothetical protein
MWRDLCGKGRGRVGRVEVVEGKGEVDSGTVTPKEVEPKALEDK